MPQVDRIPDRAGTRRARVVLVAAAALLLVAQLAPAQTIRRRQDLKPTLPGASQLSRVQIDPALRQLVDELDSESYEQREAITRQLVESLFDVDQMLAVLQREPLSAEQRHRLLQAVRKQLIRTPRGALGIRMQIANVRRGRGEPVEIVVTELLRGLPAESVLKERDIIFAVDGDPLYSQDEVIQRVQTKMPGDVVALSVRRMLRDERGRPLRDEQDELQYETVDVELTLGSADLLRDPRTGEPQDSSVLRQRDFDAREAVKRFSQSQQIPIRSGFD
ncbi:MAG: PDZ domain-containing protein, partial [Planctomycetota bacterium]